VEFDRFHDMLDVHHNHVHRGQNLDFLLRDLRRQTKLLRRHDEVFLQDLGGQHAVPVVKRRLDNLLGPVAFRAGVRIVRVDEDVCVEEDPSLHVRPS